MPIRDPKTGMTEAEICIEGTYLTFAQSMSLRVAASDFLMQMTQTEALGSDATGVAIAMGYHDRLAEVLKLMIGDRKK